jgi:hypothetical protein
MQMSGLNGGNTAAVLMKDAAEEKAERIFIRELRAAGLAEKTLRERPRSEPVKWRIAGTIRTETTVSLGWIARRLDLGSASNVCQKMRRPHSIFNGLLLKGSMFRGSVAMDYDGEEWQ